LLLYVELLVSVNMPDNELRVLFEIPICLTDSRSIVFSGSGNYNKKICYNRREKMAEKKRTIIESWPALKEDMVHFLADTDAWIIAELRSAYQKKDWGKISNVIDIMESVHNLSHSHEQS
jgi:hypothetical protein